ncbi:M28 family metallopeptidase [Hufsiella ginkgonis]|uniref:M28 family peptidase n=1 Tax=Hufsiella ginkgonis TaxID=2695274 RepID=A0A7K1XVS5_9SPHI|nr:M28 family peptidase [Hufsiella ginkgonis]MXV15082.1 M28 family peptidase [Hufsiella ginkgonis]
MKLILTLFFTTAFAGSVYAQANQPPALLSIKDADLKRDIFELAGDAFRGRRAGTADEMRAAVWVAQKAQEAGLKPAGEDGTYFQFFNINRTRTANRGTFVINGQPLALWKQVFPTQALDTHLDGAVTWLSTAADTATDLQGKIVAMKIVAPKPLPAAGMSLWGFRYTSSAIRQQSALLARRGALAVILVADETVESAIAFTGHNYEEGSYQLEGAIRGNGGSRQRTAPVILVRSAFEAVLKTAGARVKADFQAETFQYPSVNVVAKAPGTDPKLKEEYVLYSGHHDHDGDGNPVEGDSIWNGADDNASVTVGMLAIARAWTTKPGKRSALFVWHGAEERGLLGSKWFVAHPTVPKQAIAAVLNGDMIGRNSVDSAALLGTTSHKNSSALVGLAMTANQQVTKFKVDFSWDDARHPEGWYFRSDHAPYAQAGIPAIFFTSLLHPDYHTPKDEPARINIAKLAKMTKWMYATGWLISQAAAKPALDNPGP